VNVQASDLKVIMRALAGDDFESNLFDKLESHILINMSDTWFRFSTTRKFQSLNFNMVAQRELLEAK
jgi:hypothetical protein